MKIIYLALGKLYLSSVVAATKVLTILPSISEHSIACEDDGDQQKPQAAQSFESGIFRWKKNK